MVSTTFVGELNDSSRVVHIIRTAALWAPGSFVYTGCVRTQIVLLPLHSWFPKATRFCSSLNHRPRASEVWCVGYKGLEYATVYLLLLNSELLLDFVLFFLGYEGSDPLPCTY